jgi:hypothetical protein
MTAERLRVLELLQRGTITAAEAAELLRALGDEAPPSSESRSRPSGGPHWFRVRISDATTGRAAANVSIPYGVVNLGLRFAPGGLRFGASSDRQRVDDLMLALRAGRRGTLYDVTDANNGKRIEIIVD